MNANFLFVCVAGVLSATAPLTRISFEHRVGSKDDRKEAESARPPPMPPTKVNITANNSCDNTVGTAEKENKQQLAFMANQHMITTAADARILCAEQAIAKQREYKSVRVCLGRFANGHPSHIINRHLVSASDYAQEYARLQSLASILQRTPVDTTDAAAMDHRRQFAALVERMRTVGALFITEKAGTAAKDSQSGALPIGFAFVSQIIRHPREGAGKPAPIRRTDDAELRFGDTYEIVVRHVAARDLLLGNPNMERQ